MGAFTSRHTRLDRWYPFLLPISILTNAVVLYFLWAAPSVWASYGEGDNRLQKLYTSFIAPCCWRENLTAHQSPAVDQLRSRIAGMVNDGKSDDAIKETLLAEFGKRILALPEGTPRVWLFWTPFALLLAGAVAVTWRLTRMRRPPVQPVYQGPPAELEPGWDSE